MYVCMYGGFHEWSSPKIDCLKWKILLRCSPFQENCIYTIIYIYEYLYIYIQYVCIYIYIFDISISTYIYIYTYTYTEFHISQHLTTCSRPSHRRTPSFSRTTRSCCARAGRARPRGSPCRTRSTTTTAAGPGKSHGDHRVQIWLIYE